MQDVVPYVELCTLDKAYSVNALANKWEESGCVGLTLLDYMYPRHSENSILRLSELAESPASFSL